MINNYKACGHFLIVELEKVDDEIVSKAGIIIGTGSDSRKKEQNGMAYAVIKDVGRNAWVGHYAADDSWEPWAKVEDRVMLARYAGQAFPVPDDASDDEKELLGRLRLIKDDDVLCVVGGDK
jgi:hypothetical protein